MRTSLNISSWNVGGLKSDAYDKTKDPKFIAEFSNDDIVFLTETHLGYDAGVTFKKFHYFPFCRNISKNNRYFGGIGILIRKNIRKGVKFLNNGTSEYQWLKLCKEFFNFEKDIFICVVYYGPASTVNLIEILEKDINEKYERLGDIIILGDLNARTGREMDFIEDDNTHHVPLDNSNYDIDVNLERRASYDSIIDPRGRELLDFCIANKIRILNGRIVGNSTGKFTCFKYNGCSVVDYVLTSERLLRNILYMQVNNFKQGFSDCHSKLSFKILASFENQNKNENLKDFPTRYFWDSESSTKFRQTFNHPAIQNEINNLIREEIQLDQEGINKVTENIHSIFDKVCKTSLKKRKPKIKQKNHWYDKDLIQIKKIVDDKANLMNKYPRDPTVRGSFFKIQKQYSKLRKKKKREFKSLILKRLENLESENPKDYWNLVNTLRNESNEKNENSIDGEIWYKYFSKLGSISTDKHNNLQNIEEKLRNLEQNTPSFTLLDNKITDLELMKAFSQLKSGKSPGLDNISNEMLKASCSYTKKLLLKLFNAVFTSGLYPSKWSESYICPIYKSEDRNKPENYRGIAINNSLGKLFNIIMNNRFDKYLKDKDIIHETQIGFSKKARTADHIFVLKCIIEKYLRTKSKKLYACFIDFRKAFDKVIHVGIMYKLQKNNINNYFYRILKSMYTKDKLCVKINNKMTDFYNSEVGVRQGDVLSPNLFKFFINDLPEILQQNSKSVFINDLAVPCLLYADDLVIFSETKNDLQSKLDIIHNYCNEWCLEVNSNKTKIIIFNNNGKILQDDFHIGTDNLECVKQYKYLGIVIENTGKFNEARKQLFQKSVKACFKLYRDLKSSNPSIKTYVHLFNHCIKPIITYGCENWAVNILTPKRQLLSLYDIFKEWEIEKLHVKFCKYLLGVSKTCTNIGVISELGSFPIYLDVLKQIFMYWHRLENSASNLLSNAYQEYKNLYEKNKTPNSWYSNIVFYSDKLKINLTNSKKLSKYKFKESLKKCLKSNFLDTWAKIKSTYETNDDGKLNTYFKFKQSFREEIYLTSLNFEKRKELSKFRLSNHTLRIETGRHERKKNSDGKLVIIPRLERICKFCDTNMVEDELHFSLDCPLYTEIKTVFLKSLFEKFPNLSNLNHQNLFIWLMTNEDMSVIKQFCEYLKCLFELRKKSMVEDN